MIKLELPSEYEIMFYGYDASIMINIPYFLMDLKSIKNGKKVDLKWDNSLHYDHTVSVEEELIDRIYRGLHLK